MTLRRDAAASKHLVLTPGRLRALGYSPDLAEQAVTSGAWQRGAYGVYLPHVRPPNDLELVQVAREHLGDAFVVTGLLALRALELRWLPPEPQVHALVPPGVQRATNRLVRVTRTKGYDELSTWVRYDARLADPARAVVDATRALTDLREVRGVLLGAVADRWAAPAELLSILNTGQRNGSALTRRAIRDAERGCASPPEAELVDALVGRGVPFYVNPELYLDEAPLGSPDVWLVGLGTGGEVESREWHGDDDTTETTYDRHERITAPGLELVHLSVRRIRADVREAAAHLLSRASERRRIPAALREPAGLRVVPRGPLLS